MEEETESKHSLVVPLSDIWDFCCKAKKQILFVSLIFAFLGALFALTRPVHYRLDATFREKSSKSGQISNTLIAMIPGIQQTMENEAVASLQSRTLMQSLIQKLHLQAVFCPEEERDSYFRRIKNNCQLEIFSLIKDPTDPILTCSESPVHLTSLVYEKEYSSKLKIFFFGPKSYEVLDRLNGKTLGKGVLDQSFAGDSFSFTLSSASSDSLQGRSYYLDLISMEKALHTFKKKLRVKPHLEDKHLVEMEYLCPDRKMGCRVLNELMYVYQEDLKKRNDRLAALQVDYLEKKRTEAIDQLEEVMGKYATSLSEDLSSFGFADSGKEMEFLGQSQHQFKQRLISNELEIKRLQNVQRGECVYYDQYTSHSGDPQIINKVLEETRSLKQQQDSLYLAIKKSPFFDAGKFQSAFDQQMEDLQQTQHYLQELDIILSSYAEGRSPDLTLDLFQDPRYLLQTWHAKTEQGTLSEKSHYFFYLNNLKRLFRVHEKIIQERMAHQQNPSLEFQGIEFSTAKELYILYSKKLNDLEANLRQNVFLMEQMQDPQFEISSLSTVLTDSVSLQMIARGSELVLNLKDEENRSAKEQERLKEELQLQRDFLLSHLQQTNQLIHLNQQLVQEKIYALQNVQLELIHQHISVAERNLNDYIVSRLENLKQEKILIEEHIAQIQKEMSSLPQRWVTEKIIQQNVAINEFIVEQVAEMVESKNIQHKLELIQSEPVDLAFIPNNPLPPRISLYALLGALFGAVSSFGFLLARSLTKGMVASPSNLKLMQQNVAGSLSSRYSPLSPFTDEKDWNTLRRLLSYVASYSPVLLVEGTHVNYAPDLGLLWKKQNRNVVIVYLPFSGNKTDSSSGLLAYLEGKTEWPQILSTDYGDVIEGGGASPFASEQIQTKAFETLLQDLQKKYEHVLVVSQAPIQTAEAQNLCSFFSAIVVSIKEETLPQIEEYTKLTADPKKRVAFIFTHMVR